MYKTGEKHGLSDTLNGYVSPEPDIAVEGLQQRFSVGLVRFWGRYTERQVTT
jgi:hypothetical protein